MDQILDALLLACFLLCGIYALGTGFALRRQGALRPRMFLYPKHCPPEACRNPAGFRRYILPRLFLLAALCFLTAGCFLWAAFLPNYPQWMDGATSALSLAAAVLYLLGIRRCSARFW